MKQPTKRSSSKKRHQPKLKSVETVLLMEGLSSWEHLCIKDEEPQRVLRDINLLIKKSEAWGIYGRACFDIKLLLEIMANIKPYYKGRCVLVELGMMRNKRVILEHVFYIGSSTMLYNNMNVLEFLMFATAKQKFAPVYRQENIFETLISFGLGNISLTPVRFLTREEKAVITLLAAAYSDSVMVVFNLPEYKFNKVLCKAIGNISRLITEKGKTLILGTRDHHLIETACSHSAYIADGKVIYQGSVKDLRLNYDKVLFIVRDKNAAKIMDSLARRLPDCELSIANGCMLISETGATKPDPLQLYKVIIEAGFAPQCVRINPKTVQNAYGEIDRQYDLQEQLLSQGVTSGIH